MKKRRQEREKERAAAQAEMVRSSPLCSSSVVWCEGGDTFVICSHAVQEMMQRMKEAEMFSKWAKEEDEVHAYICRSILSPVVCMYVCKYVDT